MKRVLRALALALPMAIAAIGCDLPTAPPRFQPTFVLQADPVKVPVTSAAASSQATRDLRDIDPDLAARARGGAVVVSVDNPSGATGQVRVRIEGGGALVEGDVPLSATNGHRITVPEVAMRAFLGNSVTIRVSGTLCPASGCQLRPPPFPEVTFRPRIEVTFEIGGER